VIESPADVPDVDAPSATLLAIRNAFTLGGALIFTWSLALGIRIILPRALGPTAFGALSFADAFAATFFVTLSLGADAYIRKEVAVRPEHAADFYGGALLLRIAMAIGLVGGMAIFLRVSGRTSDVRTLAYVFALAQFFVVANGTLSAMLHARGRVKGMSALSVATKVIWAVGVLVSMAMHAPLWTYAASYLASESVETVILTRLAHKHLGLVFRVDRRETKRMLVSSLPYYVAGIAVTAYGKLDVTLLELSAGDKEVGLYGAASTVAGLTLLISPLIGWVMTPMLARAAARSREELYKHVSTSMGLILTAAIPASLVVNLGADLWIRVIFGAPYAPAATALRVMATMFVLTYVAIVYSTALVMLERAWALTLISVGGLVVNVTANLVLIRFSIRWFGEGGGGTGCAGAMLCTEIFVVLCLAFLIGKNAMDRTTIATTARSLAAYGVVAVVHVLLARLGYIRLPIDVALYFVLVIASGTLRPKEMLAAIREALRNRASETRTPEGGT
jgi:O-antigen/teichoic acid export membrane protein